MTPSYGPAVSRRGRIPVQFRSLPPGQSGQEEPDASFTTLLHTLLTNPSLLGSQIPKGAGTLVIDPYNRDNNFGDPARVNQTIRHEDIHGIVAHLGESANEAAAGSPYFSEIANALAQANRGGRPSDEVPAYVGSNDSQIKVDPLVKSAFWKGYMGHIDSLDSKTAGQLKSFGPGVPPAGFGQDTPSGQ